MKLRPSPAAVSVLLLLSGCGGSSTTPQIDPTPTPTSTTATLQTTSTTATTTGVDPNLDKCGSLAGGPVTRYAISPREQRADGEVTPMRVRARPGFDEVWCIDKDKEHRLDFNSNQRNAQGRECCWIDDPEWDFDDPDRMVQSGQVIVNTHNFNYRMRINPRGARGTVSVTARIDGIPSQPWQSGSGYRIEPFRIVSMSKNEIERDCLCIFLGNGLYEGDRCTK
jgi:hypothetical protein